MQRILLLSLISLTGFSLVAMEQTAMDKGNTTPLNKQSILDLCRSAKKDHKQCQKINAAFDSHQLWGQMSYVQRFWSPGLTFYMVALYPREQQVRLVKPAHKLGKEMGWNESRIKYETSVLIQEHDEAIKGYK